MFTQYFGQYLLNKGYLTTQQLNDGLEFQKDTRVKLGVLAVNAGYMRADDADRINEAQKKSDKRFGELAVEMEYLKEEQVEELLSSQKLGHIILGQVLIDKGYMTLQQFEKAVNDYKNDYGISEEVFNAIQKDNVDEMINTFIEFKGSKNEKILKDYIALFARNIIRFIDTEAVIRQVIKLEEYKGEFVALQHIEGEIIELHTYIEAEKDSFIKLASKYAEEDLNIIDEMVEASVGEFLNLQNGLFLVNMSNKNVELQVTPQEVYHDVVLHNIYSVLVELSFGIIKILIKE